LELRLFLAELAKTEKDSWSISTKATAISKKATALNEICLTSLINHKLKQNFNTNH
jgi:hypothetical protein